MTPRKNTTASPFADYARLVSASHVKALAALGHDFVEASAQGADLSDEKGRIYLDCYTGGGIHNLGRRPEAVARALKENLPVADQGNFPMISREKSQLAQRIAGFVPGPAECSIYGVVRGEVFDFACKLARGVTGKRDLVSPEGGWYGQSGFALSLTTHPYRNDFAPLVPGARIERFDSPESVRRAITDATAGVFIEPIQTENHCAAPSREIREAVRERCRETGAVLVVDETQTGFGRTGRRFAFEHFDWEPEAVLLGEALGAGIFPICAGVISQRLNRFLNAHPLIHLSTFGGSDLGCTVATAALEEYEKVKPWENAARRGKQIRAALAPLVGADESALLSMAGEGLLISLALSSSDKAERFCKALAGAGVFAKPGRVAANTVVFRPPLTIGDEHVERMVSAVKTAASVIGAKKGARKASSSSR